MKRDWPKLLSSLPHGLTIGEAAKRLNTPYLSTRAAIRMFGYPVIDGRKYGQRSNRKLKLDKVDWTKSNVAIARKFKVSRELVRLRRKQLGHPHVESRGRPRCKKST